jgi:uncharacterized protein
MTKNKNIILKILGLELLLMVFYTANGAYVTITEPSSPVLQFIGLVPLAVGIFVYLIVKKKWKQYFFDFGLTKNKILLYSPLLIVLLIILIGSKGLNTTSLSALMFMFIMQFFVVAFIEETFFRGFMLKMLLSKGVKKAVLISSFLFGITHSLQLIGGQSIEETFLQIVYAFMVGLVLSLLIINNQSIIITITFHAFNNFFNFMGQVESHLLADYFIIAILIVYTVFLWKRTNNKEHIRPNINFTG